MTQKAVRADASARFAAQAGRKEPGVMGKSLQEVFWHVVEPQQVYLLTARYEDGSCETLLPDGITIDQLRHAPAPPDTVRHAHQILGGWIEFEEARRQRFRP